MDKTASQPQPTLQDIADSGRIKFGGGYRLPMPVPIEIADSGRIKVGSCGRYPTDRTFA